MKSFASTESSAAARRAGLQVYGKPVTNRILNGLSSLQGMQAALEDALRQGVGRRAVGETADEIVGYRPSAGLDDEVTPRACHLGALRGDLHGVTEDVVGAGEGPLRAVRGRRVETMLMPFGLVPCREFM